VIPDAFGLGVDFGTSNTVAVLRWPDGRVRPLFFDGSPTLLSGVFATGSGELLAGRDAAHAARSQPECFEPNPKRHIDEDVLLLGLSEVPLVEVVAAVLGRVATEARRTAAGPVAEVTLTHPAAWGSRRRQVLRDAAVKAGLGEPRMVPEPVAAASYFVSAMQNPPPVGGNLVVYDFGAGTFDASVVRRTGGGVEVLASEGLPDAGGLDVDAAILAHLGAVYSARNPDVWRQLEQPDSVAGRRARRLLWEDVRTAKEMLSRTSTTSIQIPLLDEDAPLGREQFELLARPILARTVAATRAAVRSAGLAESAVTGLYLVGGSSRIPLAATLLHQSLRIAPTAIEQPELVVAEGSLYAPAARPGLEVTPPGLGPVLAPPGPEAPAARGVAPVALPSPVSATVSGDTVADARPAAPAEVQTPPVTAPEVPAASDVVPPPEDAWRARRAARRWLGIAVLVLLGGIAAVAIVTWSAGRTEVVVGTNAAMSAVLSPLALGVLVLALAGVGIPDAGSRPGPVGWVLARAGIATVGLTPVALILANRARHVDNFADWYQNAAWLPFIAALALLVGSGWLLFRRFRPAGPGRVRGYLLTVAAGVLCGLWWFAAGWTYGHGCSWYDGGNDICGTGDALSGIGGAAIPLGWLTFAVGGVTVLGTVGLASALLRMLFADRLSRVRPILARTGAGLFVVAALLLADLSLADHNAAGANDILGDPVAKLTNWLDTPARTVYPNGIAWFSALFVVLLIAAGSVQLAQRRRTAARVPPVT
jgi:Hsp70 protein